MLICYMNTCCDGHCLLRKERGRLKQRFSNRVAQTHRRHIQNRERRILLWTARRIQYKNRNNTQRGKSNRKVTVPNYRKNRTSVELKSDHQWFCVGRDSSVGIATRYGLDGPGIESPVGGEIYRTRPYRPRGLPSVLYEGWNFNSGNYLFTTDTK